MKRLFKIILLTSLAISTGSISSDEVNWTDQEAMVKAMEWQEQHPVFALAPTDWTNGAYYIGVTKAY